jgi:hypothetical protein
VFSFLPSITGEENIQPFALLHFVTPRLKLTVDVTRPFHSNPLNE